MLKKILAVISFVALTCSVSAQHFVGISGGYYKSNKYTSSKEFYQYGLRYDVKYPSEKAAISFEEFLTYNNSGKARSTIYAKTIAGFDFNFGNKLHYIIGLGVSTKFLLRDNDFYDESKKIVFGGKLNTGIGYYISSKILINLLYQYLFDITPSAIDVIPQHFGQSINDPIRVQQSFIQLNISLLIKNKLN